MKFRRDICAVLAGLRRLHALRQLEVRLDAGLCRTGRRFRVSGLFPEPAGWVSAEHVSLAAVALPDGVAAAAPAAGISQARKVKKIIFLGWTGSIRS